MPLVSPHLDNTAVKGAAENVERGQVDPLVHKRPVDKAAFRDHARRNLRLPKPLVKPLIRAATRADIDKYFGKRKMPLTVTAVVGLVRGRPVGCGGLAYVDGKVWAFAAFKPAARRYKVSIVKAAAQVIAEAKAGGAKYIWADVDPDEPGAPRWLRSMGFEPTVNPRYYRWAWK